MFGGFVLCNLVKYDFFFFLICGNMFLDAWLIIFHAQYANVLMIVSDSITRGTGDPLHFHG